MNLRKFNTLILAGAFILVSHQVMAHGVKCGDITVAHPYSTPTIGSVTTGSVYFMNIMNNGKELDQLIDARADVSSSVEMHQMSLENNIMRMRAVSEVKLPPGYEVVFKHGQANGFHLMLINLKKPLKVGGKFPITLKFKRAGDCMAEVWVEEPKLEMHQH